MHNKHDVLGQVVKDARITAGITRESFSERVGKTPRYIASIENEGKKPSYNTLFEIINELNIDPRLIFYPDTEPDNTELYSIIRLLKKCNSHELSVVKATLTALLNK